MDSSSGELYVDVAQMPIRIKFPLGNKLEYTYSVEKANGSFVVYRDGVATFEVRKSNHIRNIEAAGELILGLYAARSFEPHEPIGTYVGESLNLAELKLSCKSKDEKRMKYIIKDNKSMTYIDGYTSVQQSSRYGAQLPLMNHVSRQEAREGTLENVCARSNGHGFDMEFLAGDHGIEKGRSTYTSLC